MSRELYLRIAERNGLTVHAAAATYACFDFPSFLQAFLSAVKALQRPQDFADIAREYLAKSAAEGVRHVELMLSPATQRMFAPALDLRDALAAVWSEIERARACTGISAVIVLDMVRNLGVEAALRDVELARRSKGQGVVGVGLGGDERNYPARDFQAAYAAAEAAGLRRTAHAGEAAGPESIVDAVALLRAERIGHGIAAAKQPEVVQLLLDNNVAIDACPTSNAVTGVTPRGAAHPMKALLDAGVTVTLNSDDPAFFGASLLDEYETCARALQLEKPQLAQLAVNSFNASFAAQAEKKKWLAELERFVAERE